MPSNTHFRLKPAKKNTSEKPFISTKFNTLLNTSCAAPSCICSICFKCKICRGQLRGGSPCRQQRSLWQHKTQGASRNQDIHTHTCTLFCMHVRYVCKDVLWMLMWWDLPNSISGSGRNLYKFFSGWLWLLQLNGGVVTAPYRTVHGGHTSSSAGDTVLIIWLHVRDSEEATNVQKSHQKRCERRLWKTIYNESLTRQESQVALILIPIWTLTSAEQQKRPAMAAFSDWTWDFCFGWKNSGLILRNVSLGHFTL